VIKLGTSSVIDSQGKFDFKAISRLKESIDYLKSMGKEIIFVSSGAIGMGNNALGWQRSSAIEKKQAAAAVGQPILITQYKKVFGHVAQILLTYSDVEHKLRKMNFKNTINEILHNTGALIVINENDSVSVEEIRFGDNDILAAHVARLVNADMLIILSDVDGFYYDYNKKKIYSYVSKIDDRLIRQVKYLVNGFGSGGMHSKLKAAQLADCWVVLANGKTKDNVRKIVEGKAIGTLFDIAK